MKSWTHRKYFFPHILSFGVLSCNFASVFLLHQNVWKVKINYLFILWKVEQTGKYFFTICLLTFCLVSRNEVAGRAEQTKNVFVQISQVSSSILLIYPTLKNPPYYSSYTENSSILLIYPALKNPPYYKLGGIQIVLASSAMGFLANFGNSIYWEAFAKLGLWKMILIPVFEGRSNPCRETISISLPKSESDRMGLTTFSQLETTGFPIWVNDKKSFATLAS